eukprot:gene26138-biopygen14294
MCHGICRQSTAYVTAYVGKAPYL